MTIYWLFIGLVLGFITTAWICPAVDRMFRRWRWDREKCDRTCDRK